MPGNGIKDHIVPVGRPEEVASSSPPSPSLLTFIHSKNMDETPTVCQVLSGLVREAGRQSPQCLGTHSLMVETYTYKKITKSDKFSDR